MIKWFFTVFMLLFVQRSFSINSPGFTGAAYDTVIISDLPEGLEQRDISVYHKRPNPLLQAFSKKRSRNKKVVAALLAFPFPFGIVGLHRIYLGCAPYIPVVYIASLGGVFGILPFIDCCVLLLDKDVNRYINNKKVFMWVN